MIYFLEQLSSHIPQIFNCTVCNWKDQNILKEYEISPNAGENSEMPKKNQIYQVANVFAYWL